MGVAESSAQRWEGDTRLRWGTFSVRSHTRLAELVNGALLYDVLVFPRPTDDPADVRRWEANGWDPELLEGVVIQLGDHAVTTPWDEARQAVWASEYTSLTPKQRDDPKSAYYSTALMLAEQPFARLIEDSDVSPALPAGPPDSVKPALALRDAHAVAQHQNLELIVGCSRPREAFLLTTPRPEDQGTPRVAEGISLQLRLAVPDRVDEGVFLRVLDLIENDDFQQARRNLWSWEAGLPANTGPEELARYLQSLTDSYNKSVRKEVKQTRVSTVLWAVPIGAGIVLDQLTGGIAGKVLGVGIDVTFEVAKMRFPRLAGAAARASHHPGSAVDGMLSVLEQS